jgi:hypothetical protein
MAAGVASLNVSLRLTGGPETEGPLLLILFQ